MIDLLVARTIMRSKFANNAFLSFYHMIDWLVVSARLKLKKALLVNSDLMKNAAIRRSNNYYNFDLMKSDKII